MPTSTLDQAFTLVSVSDVIAQMGLDNSMASEMTPMITGAIRRATIKVEGILGTSFQARSIVDTFYLGDCETYAGNGYYKLRLSQSIVRRDVDLLSQYSDDPTGTRTVGFNTVLNPDRGVLMVPQGDFRGRYVTVSYAAGFNSEDEHVPEEVKQAILLFTPVMMLSVNSASTDTTDAPSKKTADLGSYAMDMLVSYLRNVGALVKPISTSYTDYIPLSPPVIP